MKIIEQSHEILAVTENITNLIETAGRTCYKSEDKITDDSADKFIKGIIKSGHESVIEHGNITVKFVTDRGVTHELVRHRLAAYSQASTRYCNYSKKRFGCGLTFIRPYWLPVIPIGEYILKNGNLFVDDRRFYPSGEMWAHIKHLFGVDDMYLFLIKNGQKPQAARDVLPNILKTEIVATMNVRQWRHVLKQRTSNAAHPQIRLLMEGLKDDLAKRYPVLFDGLNDDCKHAINTTDTVSGRCTICNKKVK